MKQSQRLEQFILDNTPGQPVITMEWLKREGSVFRDDHIIAVPAVEVGFRPGWERHDPQSGFVAIWLEEVFKVDGRKPRIIGWVALDYPLPVKWEIRARGIYDTLLEPMEIQKYSIGNGGTPTWFVGGEFEFIQQLGKSLAKWEKFPEPVTANGTLTYEGNRPVWYECFESEVADLQAGHEAKIAAYIERRRKRAAKQAA